MGEYTSEDQLADFADQKEKLKTLRILTVLTFVGCGFAYLLTLAMPLLQDFTLDMMNKAVNSGKDLSPKEIADMEKAKATIMLSKANLIPLVSISLVGTTMCLVGAIWMRKLKKDGFWIYSVGEILPLAGSLIFMGTSQFDGAFSTIMAIGVPVLFIVLYAMQRKHLTR